MWSCRTLRRKTLIADETRKGAVYFVDWRAVFSVDEGLAIAKDLFLGWLFLAAETKEDG